MAIASVSRPSPDPVERRGLRRVLGIDRGGPPPAATQRGAPLNPLTLPNVVTAIRVSLIPIYMVLAFQSGDGRSFAAAAVFTVAGISDFVDGLVARATQQYSRLGALLDPFVDRLLIMSAVVVAWHFELLPRWGLAVLAAREVVIVALTVFGLARGLNLQVNWFGRISVLLLMSAFALALLTTTPIANAAFLIGLAISVLAAIDYVYTGIKTIRTAGGQA